jgi:hypothetical protein
LDSYRFGQKSWAYKLFLQILLEGILGDHFYEENYIEIFTFFIQAESSTIDYEEAYD